MVVASCPEWLDASASSPKGIRLTADTRLRISPVNDDLSTGKSKVQRSTTRPSTALRYTRMESKVGPGRVNFGGRLNRWVGDQSEMPPEKAKRRFGSRFDSHQGLHAQTWMLLDHLRDAHTV